VLVPIVIVHVEHDTWVVPPEVVLVVTVVVPFTLVPPTVPKAVRVLVSPVWVKVLVPWKSVPFTEPWPVRVLVSPVWVKVPELSKIVVVLLPLVLVALAVPSVVVVEPTVVVAVSTL
jgi:hypothetical protein